MIDTPKPRMLETPDLTALRRAAQRLVDNAWNEDERIAKRTLLDDTDHYKDALYEAALEALFGPDFFEYFQERVEDAQE